MRARAATRVTAMREIEVKVIEIDKPSIVQKLLALGAAKVFDGEIDAIVYDFPDTRLEKADSTLRLRKKGDKTELTVKTVLSQSGSRTSDEIEVLVSDFETAQRILSAIGMVVLRRGAKMRTSYRLGDTLFEIDEWGDVPPFMEIEAPDEATIDSFIVKLGLPKENVKNWTSKQLRAHYETLRVTKSF